MIILLVLCLAALLVYLDASRHEEPVGGTSAGMWAVATLLMAIVVVPWYVIAARQARKNA